MDQALPFGAAEAVIAARLYGKLRSPRGGELDLAIAATAIAREATLWTLNDSDFRDIPGLKLVGSAGSQSSPQIERRFRQKRRTLAGAVVAGNKDGGRHAFLICG